MTATPSLRLTADLDSSLLVSTSHLKRKQQLVWTGLSDVAPMSLDGLITRCCCVVTLK